MLIPQIPERDKKPFTEIDRQRAFIHKDAVYLFNPFTDCLSCYCMLTNGFTYSVTKWLKSDLLKQLNFIWLSRGASEISGEEFTRFVNQITALQEQSHLIKPLTPFDDFVKAIITNYGLKVNLKFNGEFEQKPYISNPKKDD